MSDTRIEKHGLQVDPVLADFIDAKALPGTGVDADVFWKGLSDLVHDFGPRNAALLERRAEIQAQIDQYHVANRDQNFDRKGYEAFLKEIGYLVPEGAKFEIETKNVDPEIALVPGPQLVVPITNARFALNAANARWGSLYDAFYGTDAMGMLPPKGGYDRGHGSRVVARTRVFLDQAFAISGGSHADVSRYYVDKGALLIDDLPLEDPSKFVGYRGNANGKCGLCDHGLRGLRRLRGRRRQGRGLFKLVRFDARQLGGVVPKGWQNHDAPLA